MQLGRERFNRAQKPAQLCRAIAQLALVRDLAGQFARKTKMRRREVEPAPYRIRARSRVKGRIDLNGRKIARIKFQPPGFGQVARIKNLAPILEAPGTSPNPDFLLLIQFHYPQVTSDLSERTSTNVV